MALGEGITMSKEVLLVVESVSNGKRAYRPV